MRVTVKKSKLSSYGIARWELFINGSPVPVIMVRNAMGELCITWCDKDFDVCTVKLYPGTQLCELKAFFKALSYTL